MTMHFSSPWARKRQLVQLLLVLAVIAVVSIYPLFQLFYTPPSCADGKQNQDEIGVDCGGKCPQLCPSQVAPLSVTWAKAFEVEEGVYDLAALIENKNAGAGVRRLYYTFVVYNKNDARIAEKRGVTYANPNEQLTVFEANVRLPVPPARTEVRLHEDITWEKVDRPTRSIIVKNKTLLDPEGSSPRLVATLENTSDIDTQQDIEIIALVRDTKGNVTAVSSTYLQRLAPREEEGIFFTWPAPISKRLEGAMCTAPIDVVLITDRSGSMDDDGATPPQPLTDAKNAALTFLERMKPEDQVGVVSFATEASDPIDQPLSADHVRVEESIESIKILQGKTQHTNIGDAIEKAFGELTSPRARSSAKQAAVLLTDGIASRPRNPADEDDEAYPEAFAARRAAQVHEANILMYVVGLGTAVNAPFLREEVARTPDHYFEALSSSELDAIYHQIARVVCAEEVFTTEVQVRTNTFLSR